MDRVEWIELNLIGDWAHIYVCESVHKNLSFKHQNSPNKIMRVHETQYIDMKSILSSRPHRAQKILTPDTILLAH